MLILASNSPRRKQLLSLGGWNCSILVPKVNESVRSHESPEDYVLRLAEEKAAAAWRLLSNYPGEDISNTDALLVAADTAVIEQDENDEWKTILGKPLDAADAESILLRLRGRTHRVVTGLTVLRVSDQFKESWVVFSEVTMRFYTLSEILAYITTGDPFDKAGAYAIQHPTFQPVQFLQGCYANVMGLPICKAAQILTDMGCPPTRDVAFECKLALSIPCDYSRRYLKENNQHVVEK